MKPIAELGQADARSLLGIFTDIDDTLTLDGTLVPEAYVALCNAVQAGLRIVLVTGRPGGWGEVLVKLLPVAAVVAENGGLALFPDDRHIYWDPKATRKEQKEK